MAHSPRPGEIEDLTLCSFCRRPFNDGDQQPKVLSCKHHFCLSCVSNVLVKGRELYCAHCWKRTELPDLRAEALPTHSAVLALAQRLRHLAPAPPPSPSPEPQPPKTNKGDNCHTHAMPHTLWCVTCACQMCRACAAHPEHRGHAVKPQADARHQMRRDLQADLADVHDTLQDIQRLASKQREFLLRILEACTTLKTQVETDLVNNAPGLELSEARDRLRKAHRAYPATETQSPREIHAQLASLAVDRDRLHAKRREMFLQCRLDDLVGDSAVAFDFQLLGRALQGIHSGETGVVRSPPPPARQNPILFLANYCMSQLYSRHLLSGRRARVENGPPQRPFVDGPFRGEAPRPPGPQHRPPVSPQGGTLAAPPPVVRRSPQPAPLRNPSSHAYPVYYFNVEMDGAPFGRILIEVRNDAAPKMAKNFGALATGELGVGYKGCNVFQCWENESIITGDFELNNGRGGRSVFEESFFMPDDTKILAVRGSVGMRRSQKRHDNLGLVGSQFRIILREMRGFTGIFAFVVEGLELVDRISRSGDSAGKPQSAVTIASCGKLN